MTAVFFIYALDSDGDRFFWALWQCIEHLEQNRPPYRYGIDRISHTQLLRDIYRRYSPAREIFLKENLCQSIYRQVRRAELPPEIQKKIRQALAKQKRQRHTYYAALGFREEDLASLSHLKKRYRQLLMKHHPDHGGEGSQLNALQSAYADLLRKFSSRDLS